MGPQGAGGAACGWVSAWLALAHSLGIDVHCSQPGHSSQLSRPSSKDCSWDGVVDPQEALWHFRT
jgi:hypothetical protein